MESYEAEELGRYTSLSSLAVGAFLLGLGSLVALLAPLLVVIPLAGVLVSLFALVRIGRSEGALSGRSLAMVGLALSVVCGVASPLRVTMRDSLYSKQADQAARTWLLAVANNDLAGVVEQLTGNAKSGLMEPPSPGAPPPTFDDQTGLMRLGNDELVTKLREESQHGDLEFATRSITCDGAGSTPRVAVTYQTVQPDDSLTFSLVMIRSENLAKWLVNSWRLEGESAHNHPHIH